MTVVARFCSSTLASLASWWIALTESLVTATWRIAGTYHAWRGEHGAGDYADVPGFCASVTTDHIAEHGHVLTPGRYVGAGEADTDDEPFDKKIERLTQELFDAFDESDRLQTRVRRALEHLDASGVE